MECGCVTKYKGHPWPTDGVTKKQVDRIDDRLGRRMDRAVERIRKLEAAIAELRSVVILDDEDD